jgi:hypothetical protein
MKQLALCLIFCASSNLFACEAIWNNGPSPLLQNIFTTLKLEDVNDLTTAKKIAKEKLRRPKNKERWETYQTISAEQKDKIKPVLFDSVMTKRVLPSRKGYEAVAVLGATVTRVKNRLEYFCELLANGLSFKTLYLLGSDRDLRSGNLDDQSYAIKLVQKGIDPTEMQMMVCLWADLKLKHPELRDVRVIFVQASKKADGNRAGTIDNLEAMLKLMPDTKGKYVLFVSNNPYIAYQDSVCKKALKKSEITVETVGDAAAEGETIENILDSVAMTLENVSE